MRRPSASRIALAITASLVLLCAVAAVAAAASHVWLFEAPLNPSGEAFEVNSGAGGAVWVSDVAASEVWQVQSDGSYTVYGGLDGVWGARPGAAGEVWYGSTAGCTLGRLSTTAPGAMTWTLGAQDCSTLATAYDGSRVWATDYANSRLYSLDNSNLCTYALPGGLESGLAVQGGQIWYGDSSNARIVRVDPSPATPQATSWQLPAEANPFGLASDSDGTVWWTDPSLATVNHFDPATNSLTTYALPADSKPEHLVLLGGKAWYTDDRTGAIGQVDPAAATGAITTLTATPATVSRTCQVPPAGTPHAVTVRQGTLTWATGSYTTPPAANGVTVYQLASGALPWGIAASGNTLLSADRGRKVLERLAITDLPSTTYLPFIHR